MLLHRFPGLELYCTDPAEGQDLDDLSVDDPSVDDPPVDDLSVGDLSALCVLADRLFGP